MSALDKERRFRTSAAALDYLREQLRGPNGMIGARMRSELGAWVVEVERERAAPRSKDE